MPMSQPLGGRIAWLRRWWIIGTVAVFTAAAVIFALTSERIYRATAVLAQAEAAGAQGGMSSLLGQVGGLASLAGINLTPQRANVEEALAVLRSREFTERFFKDEHVIAKFYPKDWDEKTQTWKAGSKPPSRAKAYVYFDTEVRTIVMNRKTGLVTLQIDWTDRFEAARWANELVARINAEMRRRAIEESTVSIQFLEKELAATSVVEIRQAINRLIEGQIKQRMLATVSQEYAFRVIDAAMVPEIDEPVWPHRRKIVMIAAALGFVFAMAGMIVFDYFSSPTRNPENA
jgi:LPS O-antigen subunit length determinant protein (WzzB/FepE family)